MFQEIAPHTFSNAYLPTEPKAGDIVLSFAGNDVLLKDETTFFHVLDLPDTDDLVYLFRVDHTACFLTRKEMPNAYHTPVSSTRGASDVVYAFIIPVGWQLYRWYASHIYCGKCAHPLAHSENERALVCPECGTIIYPTISPAVIVGVLNEKNELLLTKYAHGNRDFYALVAGFQEIGETIEETVHREVYEETGLHVSSLHFYKSQPWPFSSSSLMGFFCKADSHEQIQLLDGELKEAVWVDRSHDLRHTENYSLTAEMMQFYRNGGTDSIF